MAFVLPTLKGRPAEETLELDFCEEAVGLVAPVYCVGTVYRRGSGESHIGDVDGRYLRAHQPRLSRKTHHSGRRAARGWNHAPGLYFSGDDRDRSTGRSTMIPSWSRLVPSSRAGSSYPDPEEQTRRPVSSRSDTQARTPVSSAGGLAESSERKGFRRSSEHEPDGHDQHQHQHNEDHRPDLPVGRRLERTAFSPGHGVSPHVMVVCPRSTRP
jgi:hypothetical protein